MKLQVIAGSIRQGRVTGRIAKWVANLAKELPDVEVEIVDLAEYPMPLFDEAIPPQYNPNRKPDAVVQKWLSKLGEADGFVLVTPEYNRSYPGALKNALDFVDSQFVQKPVAIVAHGSTGGAQSVSHLRAVFPELKAVTVPEASFLLDRIGDKIDDDGVVGDEHDVAALEIAVKNTLQSLAWYTTALKAAR